MPQRRSPANAAGAMLHVFNRGAQGIQLFSRSADYVACLRILARAQKKVTVPLHAYCLMPTHFHLVVQPSGEGDISEFMQWFCATHSKHWHWCRKSTGRGAVYQSRFKARVIDSDWDFLAVCRYVERNPLKAGLVRRAEDWPWSSLAQRMGPSRHVRLSTWPVEEPGAWVKLVNDSSADVNLSSLDMSALEQTPHL